MPVFQYFLWVGGILLCLMFAFDAYLPRLPAREAHEIDRTPIRIASRGPEFATLLAPDESEPRPVEAKPAVPVRQAFAKFEPERKARPRHKRPVEDAAREGANARVAEQTGAASSWSNNSWSGNSWSNNNWSNNNWSNNNWSRNWSSTWR